MNTEITSQVFVRSYWNYYIELEDQLLATKRFVDFSDANFKTFSIEYLKLLQATCSEIDVVAKIVAEYFDPQFKSLTNKNIQKWGLVIQTAFPQIGESSVCFNHDHVITPWNNWKYETYQNKDNQTRYRLEDQLAESDVIKKERLPLFHEAFLLYQLGYYYGAVAILINQIVGITADIESFLKSNNASYDPKTVELMEKRYRVTSATDTGRVMTAVVEGKNIDEDEGEYGYLLGYLRFKVFNTHMPKDETQKHTNRHLLCHGAQLNYGTKEHALKVILCIDALMWVGEVIADNLGD